MRNRVISKRLKEVSIDKNWLETHLNKVEDVSIILTKEHLYKLYERYGHAEFIRRLSDRCPSLSSNSQLTRTVSAMEQAIKYELEKISKKISKLERLKNET